MDFHVNATEEVLEALGGGGGGGKELRLPLLTMRGEGDGGAEAVAAVALTVTKSQQVRTVQRVGREGEEEECGSGVELAKLTSPPPPAWGLSISGLWPPCARPAPPTPHRLHLPVGHPPTV